MLRKESGEGEGEKVLRRRRSAMVENKMREGMKREREGKKGKVGAG